MIPHQLVLPSLQTFYSISHVVEVSLSVTDGHPPPYLLHRTGYFRGCQIRYQAEWSEFL